MVANFYLLTIIIIIYSKPNNRVQTNNYYQIDIITGNHIIISITKEYLKQISYGSLRGVVDNVLDCKSVVNGFEFKSCYPIHFPTNALRKVMNSLIPQIQEDKISVLFYEDGFDITYLMNIWYEYLIYNKKLRKNMNINV